MYLKNEQPLIGVVTASASLSEQRQILTGIISQAEEFGAAVAVFSNIYNAEEYFAEVEVENRIYDYIVSKKLDGLILTAESFINPDVRDYIYRRLLERTDIPIVVTGAKLEGFPCVDTCVRTDVEDIVRHLMEVHGFRDIVLLTGGKEYETSLERVDGYRAVLEEFGVPFDEEKVIYGNFWTTSGEALANEYIAGTRQLPEAIVCANDYMAYGLCDAFLAAGIAVPKDVTVVGYEYVGERFYHAPILTTYQRNRQATGAQAVRTLWELMTGEAVPPISLAGYMVLGDSCSCGADRKMLCKELETTRREQFYSNLNLVGNFEQQLTTCRSIDDYVHTLQQFAYMIRDVKALHLCLYETWCNTDITGTPQDTEMMVYYRIISQKNVADEPIYYRKYDLFPDEVPLSESGDVLYFCPIFFAGRELGYFLLQYDHPDCYDIIFRDWLKIATNALEILRMKNDIGTLLECRNLSEFHDSVTGLYNLNGLEHELHMPLKQASETDQLLLVMVRSELFQDSGSLEAQELSTRMDVELAEQLKKLGVEVNAFCARLSSKRYLLAAVGEYTMEMAQSLSEKLRTLILHAPLYSTKCGCSSLLLCTECLPAAGIDFSEALDTLHNTLENATAQLAERRNHPYYQQYTALRDMVYQKPEAYWDAQQACREFHLSYGHFRATYKALFDISFHQDVICSRISLAKYLLLTSALSLPMIADRCGYQDDKYFLRQFRQMTGMSPHAYRSHPNA